MSDFEPSWLLLTASLPGRDATTARVRLWRTLKDAGTASLRDGVSVLPASAAAEKMLGALAKSVEADGGAAWIFALPEQAAAIERKLKALFDRSSSYAELASSIAAFREELSELDEANARRGFRGIERDFQAVAALDFFPGAPHARLQRSIDKLRAAIDRRFSPAEPSALGGAVTPRNAKEYQSAVWATRKRPWVDRIASAWLIRRFIDRRAHFEWLDAPGDCPADAHGFDFDGAEFTHVGNLVTFEVLLAAFGVEKNRGLVGVARLVHYLDVGGEVVPEAAGFEAVLAGLRSSASSDDALLAAAMPVLDALHLHYSSEPR